MNGYEKVVNEEQDLTFYVEKSLAREIEGHYVELSSLGALFPRYYISSVRELDA
ncbi:MAG: hypothetical protein GX079_02100 [Tissierellia bacterium]|nr:hypothetical protein [Tissierellia bacterium]